MVLEEDDPRGIKRPRGFKRPTERANLKQDHDIRKQIGTNDSLDRLKIDNHGTVRDRFVREDTL